MCRGREATRLRGIAAIVVMRKHTGTWRAMGFAVVLLIAAAEAGRAAVTDGMIGGTPASIAEAAGPVCILPESDFGMADTSPPNVGARRTVTTWVRVDDTIRQRRSDGGSTVLSGGNRGLGLTWPLAHRRALRMETVEGWSTAEYVEPDQETRLHGSATTLRVGYGPVGSEASGVHFGLTDTRALVSGVSAVAAQLFQEQGLGGVRMPYRYLDAHAGVTSRTGRWHKWLEVSRSRVDADVGLSVPGRALLLPLGQEGVGCQVRVTRGAGRSMWAVAAGATERDGRGEARYNGARVGDASSRFSSQHFGVGWRGGRGGREWEGEIAYLRSSLSLQASVWAPADLAPLPGTKVEGRAEMAGAGHIVRIASRRCMGSGWHFRTGLLLFRGSARYDVGYQSYSLWGLVPLAGQSKGVEYRLLQVGILGLGVERRTGDTEIALGAAQGFGWGRSEREAAEGGAVGVAGASRGGRVIGLSVATSW